MRTLLYGAAALALAAAFSADALRSTLAASASALFETTPFLMAGIAAARLFPRQSFAVEYLGCGCGPGPSARSLPAAVATWILFGAPIAAARCIAALIAARVLRRAPAECRTEHAVHPLGELDAVLPAALLAGAALQASTAFDPSRFSPFAGALAGAALGFASAPCGLGAVTLASALRVRAPVVAAAFLCVAGIVDARALTVRSHARAGHDALGYAALAASLAVVAARGGGALVHPRMTLPLACCAIVAAIYAVVHRRARCAAARFAPALMLAAAFVGPVAPQYHATETTLADLFAGERLTFTGQLARDAGATAVVRYAITCCRADAAPVAVRLDRAPPLHSGTWVRVDGRVESVRGAFRLAVQSIVQIAPPNDPFVYR